MAISDDLKSKTRAPAVQYPPDAELSSFEENIAALESLLFRCEIELSEDSPAMSRLLVFSSDVSSLHTEVVSQMDRAVKLNDAYDINVVRVRALIPRLDTVTSSALLIIQETAQKEFGELKAKYDTDIAALDARLDAAREWRDRKIAEIRGAAHLGGAPPAPPVDNAEQNADDENMNTKIAKLEAAAESTAKSLDAIQRRVDDGFKEMRADSAATHRRLDDGLKEVRAEASSNFKVLMGIQVTTLLAILGVLAKAAKLF